MKTKKRGNPIKSFRMLLITALLLCAGAVAAEAGTRGPTLAWQAKGIHDRHHQRFALGCWRNPDLVRELELSDDQVDRLKNADYASRERRLKVRAQLDAHRLAMEKAFCNEPVDEAAVRKLAEQMANLKGNLVVETVDARLALHSVLTADQMNKLQAYRGRQWRNGQGQDRGAASGCQSQGRRGHRRFSTSAHP